MAWDERTHRPGDPVTYRPTPPPSPPLGRPDTSARQHFEHRQTDLAEAVAAMFDVPVDMLRPATASFWRSLHQVELRRAMRYRRALVTLGAVEAVTLFVAALGWWAS
jgi:hypothetical protein